jgi:DNA polymerase III subunit epsilon
VRKSGVASQVLVFSALAALAMIGLAIAGLLLVAGSRGDGGDWPLFVLLGLALLGLLFLWQVWSLLRAHFIALERLRGAVLNLAGNATARLPLLRDGEAESEIRNLHAALAALEVRTAQERAAPDDRLHAVLASIPDAMLVITDDGQVSLVNYAAKALLGAERVAVGSSVYAALSRTTVRAAVDRARRAGGPVDAMIGTLEEHQLTAKVAALEAHGGAVITVPAEEVEFRAELEVDLALHDQPPPAEALDDDMPLGRLPVLVLDTETTGLDVTRDRVVSIGGLRLVGGRMYRATSFDHLVNPGMAIPPRSTAIHGITDPMVADAPAFPEVFAALDTVMAGTVVVGHQIAFDLAMLRAECARNGCVWSEPLSLDTLLLATSLLPGLSSASLDAVAGELGVSVHGRHTALGDSLVTAEVFASLLPRLADQGVLTLGQATAFCRRAKGLVRAQSKAGW